MQENLWEVWFDLLSMMLQTMIQIRLLPMAIVVMVVSI